MIADLRGAIGAIGRHAEQPGTLITLGDYIDRGPQSRQIITHLMYATSNPSSWLWQDWKLICLKGNHEDIMWQTCRRPLDPDWWLSQSCRD